MSLLNIQKIVPAAATEEAPSSSEWASFLVHVGAQCAALGNASRAAFVAVSLPTLCFGPALVAFGALLETIRQKTRTLERSQNQFEELCELEGASVAFSELRNGRLFEFQGVIVGPRDWKGQRVLSVKYYEARKGKATYFRNIYPSEISSVRLIRGNRLDLSHIPKPKTENAGGRFLQSFLTEDEIAAAAKMDPALLVVDSRSRFNDETAERILYSPGVAPLGCIADLLRPNSLPQYSASPLTLVESPASQNHSTEEAPRVVLLAGKRALHRIRRHSGCTVAILDRSDREYGSTVDTINHLYFQRADDIAQDLGRSNTIAVSAFYRQ